MNGNLPDEWTAGAEDAAQRLTQWNTHRAGVRQAAQQGGKRVLGVRCGLCPPPRRRDDLHGDVIRTDSGLIFRAFFPTYVADRDSGMRMTLAEIRAWEQDQTVRVRRDQADGWLLDDPVAEVDPPQLECKVHGAVPVDVAQLGRFVAEGSRLVQVTVDRGITPM